MILPIPDLDDCVDDDITPSRLMCHTANELPFALYPSHIFNTLTNNNLSYDQYKPLYSTHTSSCTVYVAESRSGQKKNYALKVSKYVKRLRQEYENYKLIGFHPTITRCYEFWISKGEAWLQLELGEYGSIQQMLTKFTNEQIWTLVAHISNALDHLHSKGLMHLDVSPSNIVHTKVPHIGTVFKLTDFGTMKKYGTFDEDDEGAGPYVSPEALVYPHTAYNVDGSTDIWSFGLVLYEVITKKSAPRDFPGYEQLRNGTFQLAQIPEEFSFVVSMLNVDPTKRPTAAELGSLPRCQEILTNFYKNDGSPVTSFYAKNVAQTPYLQHQKMPPETPYANKYKRDVNIDDETFSNYPDI